MWHCWPARHPLPAERSVSGARGGRPLDQDGLLRPPRGCQTAAARAARRARRGDPRAVAARLRLARRLVVRASPRRLVGFATWHVRVRAPGRAPQAAGVAAAARAHRPPARAGGAAAAAGAANARDVRRRRGQALCRRSAQAAGARGRRAGALRMRASRVDPHAAATVVAFAHVAVSEVACCHHLREDRLALAMELVQRALGIGRPRPEMGQPASMLLVSA